MRTRTPADVDAALASRQARRGIAEAHAAHTDEHIADAIAHIHQWCQDGGHVHVDLLADFLVEHLSPAYRHNTIVRNELKGMR